MALKEVLDSVLNDLETESSDFLTLPEVKKEIKKTLRKKGLKKIYPRVIKGIDDHIQFIRVLEKMDQHLNPKKYKWGGLLRTQQESVFEMIKKIYKRKGIEKAIETLAESGYKLETHWDIKTFIHIYENHYLQHILIKLTEDNTYKKYSEVFKTLKSLDYEKIHNYSKDSTQEKELKNIMRILELKGDVIGGLYILAANGHKIDKKLGITETQIKSIEKLAKEAQEEVLKGKGSHMYLYETGFTEIFQEYFKNLKPRDKREVLKSILNYEENQNTKNNSQEIKRWLEEEYKELIRKITLES